jgi:hypothetical protein
MNRILILLALVTISDAVAADPAPILVVREMDPWRMVIGSDSAKFAIYDDGSVIYQTAKPTAERPFSRRKIEDPSKVAKTLLGFDPATVDAEYELSSATDQISTTIWTPERVIEIYGDWREPLTMGTGDDPDLKAIDERERKMWEALPKEVRAFLAKVEKEQEKEGDPWLPESIEVMLWPYEYAPEKSIIWPQEWPDLNSKDTRKRGEDSYSVFLLGKSYSELLRFISTRKEKGAVLINGKKMSISYRFPFPMEASWMRRTK